MSRLSFIKARWPLLLARWAVFSLVIAMLTWIGGADTRAIALIAIVGGGLLNIAWYWVA